MQNAELPRADLTLLMMVCLAWSSEHCKHLGGDSRVDPTQFEVAGQGSAGAFVDGADKEGLQKHAELQAELNVRP